MNDPKDRPLPPPKSLGTTLVVGGCGFVGRHLVDQLLNFPSESSLPQAKSISLGANTGRYSYNFAPLSGRYPSFDQSGTKVHALDLRCTKNRLAGCTYHEADITDAQALLEVFKKVQPDVVINTASPQWNAPPAILRKVNVEGTRTLLEVAGKMHGDWSSDGKKRCKAFVHTSSSSVIHDTQSNLRNADERYPLQVPNKVEYYSETKAVAENLVLQHNASPELGGMFTAAVRPAGVIGELDFGGFGHGITKTASVAPGWQCNLQLGEGDNLFDTTYVGNVALGLLLVAEGLLGTARRQRETGRDDGGVLEHERVAGEAFIVTNDEPAYFWELTRYIYSRYGREGVVVKGRDGVTSLPEGFAWLVGGFSELVGRLTGRQGKLNRQTVKYSCIDRYFSCEKIKRRCGYIPVVGVEEGLARTVQWFKDFEIEESMKSGQDKKVQ